MSPRFTNYPVGGAPPPADVAQAPLAASASTAQIDAPESCPVIYADEVLLGLTGSHRLRVVFLERREARRVRGS